MSQQQATMRLPMPWEDGEPRRDKDGRVFRFDPTSTSFLAVFYRLPDGQFGSIRTAVTYNYLVDSVAVSEGDL